MRLVVASLLVISFGLYSCGVQPRGAESTPQPGKELLIATDPEVQSAGMTALIVGTLRGQVNPDDSACFRLVDTPNPAFSEVPLYWPHGYSARDNPLRVIDRYGKTVAINGQRATLGGGMVTFNKEQFVLGCGQVKTILVAG